MLDIMCFIYLQIYLNFATKKYRIAVQHEPAQIKSMLTHICLVVMASHPENATIINEQ